MDNSQLAALMLEWENTQRKADELAAQIKDAVMAIGKTQVVGNVRATFSAGRRTFDYETAVGNAIEAGTIMLADIEPWKNVEIDYSAVAQSAIQDGIIDGKYLTPYIKMVYDYAAVAKALKLEIPVTTQGTPSVTLKLA